MHYCTHFVRITQLHFYVYNNAEKVYTYIKANLSLSEDLNICIVCLCCIMLYKSQTLVSLENCVDLCAFYCKAHLSSSNQFDSLNCVELFCYYTTRHAFEKSATLEMKQCPMNVSV